MNFSSGVRAVDEMLTFDITGNVIVPTWFTTISENDKANLLAINILAEIVYWYRPKLVRDETTGQVIGYRKKFKGTMIKKSLNDFAELFNQSKTSVQRAVVLLEELGVIKRHKIPMKTKNNKEIEITYIELLTEGLRRVTYPKEYMDVDKAALELPLREDIPNEKYDNGEFFDIEQGCSNMERGCSNPENISFIGNPSLNFDDKNTGGCSTVEQGCSNMERGCSNMERNNRDYIENNKENNIYISSSSNSNTNLDIKENEDEEEDEKRKLLRERLEADKVAKMINNDMIVSFLIDDLLAREKEILEKVTPDAFSDICLDILSYPHRITNYGCFIKKCVDNYLVDMERRKTSKPSSGGKTNAGYEQHDYDFKAIEEALLGQHRSKEEQVKS